MQRGMLAATQVVLSWLGMWSCVAAAPLSIDDAREISQKTGAPLFAVAGSST